MAAKKNKNILNPNKIKVFISYANEKEGEKVSNEEARLLANVLEQTYGFRVFFDKKEIDNAYPDQSDSIPTAAEWEKTIYDNVIDSDVLLVLLRKETAESDWVQREVDMARGANIKILPIALADLEEKPDIEKSLERLVLRSVQYETYCSPERAAGRLERQLAADHALTVEQIRQVHANRIADTKQKMSKTLGKIATTIERLSRVTRKAQKAWATSLAKRRKPDVVPTQKSRQVFPIEGHACQIHLSTGDIAKLKGIDVIVNSENDYMQMARLFENFTMSSKLRYLGSLFNEDGDLIEDTLQDDLNARVKNGRPIHLGRVFATRSGHPKSQLVEHKIRYIFHAATVQIEMNENPPSLKPMIDPEKIVEVVTNCLLKVHEVNKQHGVSGRPEADYQDITSIAFPLINTGHLDREVGDVVPHMLDAFESFVENNPDTSLREIHLLVYFHSHLAPLLSIMQERLG